MSDLFKRHRPKLSEDEERALWERVRTIPREAGGRSPAPRRRSPWEVLWARPAIRYGAPALAVALVAFVWIAQQEPVAPARRGATAPSTPSVATEGTEERSEGIGMADAPDAAAPAPTAPRPAPEQQDTPSPSPRDRAAATAPGQPSAQPRVEYRTKAANTRLLEREAGGEGATSGGTTLDLAAPPSAATSAPAPAPVPEAVIDGSTSGARKSLYKESPDAAKAEPQAAREFRRENPRVGAIRPADEAQDDAGRVAELRAARGSSASATLLGDRILVEVLTPTANGTFLETVTLPLSGGTARIAAATSGGTLRIEGARARDLIRIAGSEGEASTSTRRRIDLATGSSGAGAAAIVAPDRRALTSHFVSEDGDERALTGPRSSARSRAAALAAELILAVRSGDARAVSRVHAAAARLREERPNDSAARALLAWSEDARTAFGPR